MLSGAVNASLIQTKSFFEMNDDIQALRTLMGIPAHVLADSTTDLAETSETINADLALLGGPRINGLRRRNREWQWICIEMLQERRA